MEILSTEEQARFTISIGIIAIILAFFAIGQPTDKTEHVILEIIGILLAGYLAIIAIKLTPKEIPFGDSLRNIDAWLGYMFYFFGVLFAIFYAIGYMVHFYFGVSIGLFLVIPAILFLLTIPLYVARYVRGATKSEKKKEAWLQK